MISISFNGATLMRPGAFSKFNIDLSGGFPLGPTGLVAIFGESTRGKPGSEEADISKNVYTASQMPEIIQKYGSGPIVDACQFLFSPASDGAIPSGAQAVYIYKTNASTRASLQIETGYGKIRSLEYGIGGNRITFKNTLVSYIAPKAISGIIPAFGAALDGAQFDIRINGEFTPSESVTLGVGTHANLAALLVELNAQLAPIAGALQEPGNSPPGDAYESLQAGSSLVVRLPSEGHTRAWEHRSVTEV